MSPDDRVLRLVQSVTRLTRSSDDLSASFAQQLDLVLRDTERQLRPLIAKLAEGNPTAVITARRANAVRIELRDALKAAGYDDLADQATGQPLDDVVRELLAAQQITKASAVLTAAGAQRIEALKALQLTDLLEEGDVTARALWQATVRGVFGSRDTDQILSDLADVLDRSAPHIRTLYDTSISVFGRQVEALQAGDDPEALFAYMGPADEKTRPFCLVHVGRVYTRQQIDAMDNGQLDNVFLTAGGYNCRHMWMAVSKFSGLTDLVNTEARIPEVQAQLDRFSDAA